jgi:hypothetical protein
VTNILYDALFARHAQNEAPFLDLDDGTTLTYAGFVARVAQLAHVLTDQASGPATAWSCKRQNWPTLLLYTTRRFSRALSIYH